MGNLILWNVVTLDGFFEGPKSWDLGWHDTVWGEELEQLSVEQLRSADMLLFGRVTYEGMAAYWPSQTGEIAEFMNNLPKVVFSKTLHVAEWNNTRIVRENAEAGVAEMKRDSGRNLYIFGSANLSSTLMRHGLIDEYRLCVAPVVLGAGNPLFKPGSDTMRLELLEARPLKSGGVLLRYRPQIAATS